VNDPDEIPYAPRRIGLPPTPAPKGGLDTWVRIVLIGLTIGFAGWVVTFVFPNAGRRLMPWRRDPVTVPLVTGWVDRFPEMPDVGACRPETAKPADLLVALPDGRFQTPRRGEVLVECEHRVVLLSVRRSARLALAAPERMMRNTPATARLQAYDMNGEQLRMGEGVRVTWRAEGGLEVRGDAAGSGATLQAGAQRGLATVIAEFDSLTARAPITIE
jgi:hypothetical protein